MKTDHATEITALCTTGAKTNLRCINSIKYEIYLYFLKKTPLVFALILILTGCTEIADQKVSSSSIPVVPELPQSCQIALTPHQGTSKADNDIIRFQQAPRNPNRTASFLERLGWAYIAKARLSFDPGYYKLAEQTALCMESKQPGNSASLLLKGHVYHSLHRFKEAQEIANRLVENRGQWFDFALLGDALMEQGNLADAGIAYQAMIDQYPASQTYSRAANFRWLTGDTKGAIELLRMSLKSVGHRDIESRAWILTRLAGFEFQLKNFESSLNYLSEAIYRLPNYAPALLAMGKLYLAQNWHDKAAEVLSQALQLNPLPEYRWALIEALNNTGKQELVQTQKTEILKNGAVEDRRTFALYLASTGSNPQLALTLAQQELNVRADVFTLDTLAWALRAVGKSEQAYDLSKNFLAEGTENARLFYHAGVIAEETNHFGEARELLARAIAIQHQLWPSERHHLIQKFAAITSQPTA